MMEEELAFQLAESGFNFCRELCSPGRTGLATLILLLEYLLSKFFQPLSEFLRGIANNSHAS